MLFWLVNRGDVGGLLSSSLEYLGDLEESGGKIRPDDGERGRLSLICDFCSMFGVDPEIKFLERALVDIGGRLFTLI